MACMALKRSHFDLPSPGQEACAEPSAKRRCSFAALSPCASSPPRPFTVGSCAPILSQSQVSRERILADVNGELKLIRRRRRRLALLSEEEENQAMCPSKRSVTPSRAPSDSDRDAMAVTPTSIRVCESGSRHDKPVFSTKQVAEFCKRRLLEREEELTALFDQILTQRLTEQYDMFVRYTEENLKRRFANRDCSYVS